MKTVWILVLFLMGHLFAGDIDRVRPPFLRDQYLPVPGFHSVGFRNITGTPVSDIGLANPAVLDLWSRMSGGISFGYHTSIPDFANTQDLEVTLSQYQPWIPVAAGWVFPIKNGRIGLAYHQSYNFQITTSEFPIVSGYQDTVGTTRFIEHQVIHSFSGLASYSFSNVFHREDRLTLGATVTGDYLSIYSEVFRVNAKLNDLGFSFKMGFSYRLPHFAIGLVYQHRTSVEGDVKFNDELQSTSQEMSYLYYVKLPARYALGFHWVVSEKWQLNGTIAYVRWKQLPYDYHNAWNYSASVLRTVGKGWLVSGGFYRRGLKMDNENLDQSYTYLVGGLRYRKKAATVFLEVWDNHVNAEESYQHTYFVLGAGIELF
jgi:hypothetical protein